MDRAPGNELEPAERVHVFFVRSVNQKYSMKNFRKIILTAIGVGFVASGGALAAEFFIHPAAWYADYDADGFDAKIGPAVEAGGYLGAEGRHALSVETARLPWSMSLAAGTLGTFGMFGDGHLAPVLGSYRYEFKDAAGRWGVYVGASAGVTKVSGRLETVLSGVKYAGDVSDWATTLVGTIGVSATVAPNLSVELACRYAHLDGVDYDTRMWTGGAGGFTGGAGPQQSYPAKRVGIVSLGLRFRL